MNENKGELETIWNNQYNDNENTALKDKNLFELEFNAIFSAISDNLQSRKKIRILELGCGTGFLIKKIIEKFNKSDVLLLCDCVDFSKEAIELAREKKIKNVNFYCEDFFDFFKNYNQIYDFIISQRSIMAIMDHNKQINLLNHIQNSLNKTGIGILSECFEEQLIKLNNIRNDMGLKNIEKVWHSLYLTRDQFKNIFINVKFIDFCSTYFFVTRVIYPFFNKPMHNQEIHEKAAKLPNTGDFSFLKLVIVKNCL